MTETLNRTETAVLKELIYCAGKELNFKPRSQWMRVSGTLAGTSFIFLVKYDGASKLRRLRQTAQGQPLSVQINLPF